MMRISIAALLLAGAAAAAPADRTVTVDNTAANPVPTVAQGTTQIAGSVTVVNTPTVNIGTLPPLQIASAATQFVQVSGVGTSGIGDFNLSSTLYTVPAGKLLVVETVSVQGTLDHGTQATCQLGIYNPGSFLGTFFAFPLTNQGGFNLSGTQSLKVYATAGQTVVVSVISTVQRNPHSDILSFAGHLEPAP